MSKPTTMSRAGGGDSAIPSVLWRRRATVLTFAVLGLIAGAVYLLLAEKIYTVTTRLLVTQAGTPAATERPVAETTPAGPATVAEATTKLAETFHATQAQVLRSTPVLAGAAGFPGADDLKTFSNVRNRILFLKERVDARTSRDDEVITLSLRTAYPQEGVTILDRLVQVYESFQKKQRRAGFEEVRGVLEEEQKRIEQQLADAEARLAEFRLRNPSVSSDDASPDAAPEDPAMARRIQALQEALTKAEIETIDRRAEYTTAVSAVGPEDLKKIDAAVPPGPVGETELNLIRQELTDQQKRLTQLSRAYLPSHPAVRQVQQRLGEIGMQLLGATKARWVQAQQRESDLRKSLEAETAVAAVSRQAVQGLRELIRERDRLAATAGEVDRKLKDLNLAVDAGAITTQVIDPPAFDARSFTPHASLVLPVAGLGGLLLGSLVALLRESADPRVVSPQGARVLLGVPVLGTVPPSSSGRSLETFGWAIHADAAGPVAGSRPTVRTSLQYAMSDPPARRVCVVSPDQMDGKSTLASNLAIALAKSGRNVLLVDANLREPVQHRIFGVSDAVGLVDILAAGELNERAVRRTTIEHLHVLPAGQVGPAAPASATGAANPSELLNSSGFTDTLDRLAERYDVVLVDTPASAVVDDARIVAAACDGAVLVLRAGKTNRRSAVAARDGLLSVGCRVLGTVVNVYRGASVGALGGPDSGSAPVRYHRSAGKTGNLGRAGGFADELNQSIRDAD